MASGGRRLGTFLSLREDLLATLRVLDATAAPRGAELAAATALQEFCSERWPTIGWQLQPIGVHGANLAASHGAGPLLYSHLDTSLSGGPRDVLVTGREAHPDPLRITEATVDGFGVGVARAPAAAALVGFAGASSGHLLLASSGTHRRAGNAAGLDAWLRENPLPPSAIVAKCGPPGVLWSEPGACYLTVVVTGRQGAVMAPLSAIPAGGVAAHCGVLLAAIYAWCRDYLAAQPAAGQLGAAAGIGTINAGWSDKADLLPAAVEIGLYLVTLPGVDTAALANDLLARVRAAMAGSALDPCTVTVTREVVHAAAATEAAAPIVSAARVSWTRRLGYQPCPITGWTGSTDGVVLRAHGIDTVRLGPQSVPVHGDERRDLVNLDDLAAFALIYRELLSGVGADVYD